MLARPGRLTGSPRRASAVFGSLDGLSPSGAWSPSRNLLTDFSSARAAESSGAFSAWNDQSGGVKHLLQATAADRPLVGVGGPNNRACAVFDGVSDYLSGAALSNFIANDAGYVVVTCMFDAITLNNVGSYTDHCVIGEAGGGYFGLFGSNTGSPKRARAYNYDGSEDYASENVLVEGQVHVLEWRHQGGNLYLRVDGGAWSAPTLSGNTQVLTGALRVGLGTSSGFFNGKLFEAATFSTVPESDAQDAVVANWMAWAGVGV